MFLTTQKSMAENIMTKIETETLLKNNPKKK
jgi:hypothetical protein